MLEIVFYFLLLGSVLSFTANYEYPKVTKYIQSKKMRKFLNQMNSIDESPISTLSSATDVYTPPEVGAEIYIGSAVALVPIIWATYEFWSRIQTQQKCLVCNGSGLVRIARNGNALNRPRKCWSCGGFLPWLGWKMFFFSSFVDPGNGGVLQRPSKDYEATNELIRQKKLENTVDDNIEKD